MPSTFADAMHEFVQASHGYAGKKWLPDAGAEAKAERRLAQAGDVLEREIRQMMREAVESMADEARRDVPPILLRVPLTGSLDRG